MELLPQTSFIRIFERSEFGAHPDWPADIGLAYAVRHGEPDRIYPWHESESAEDVLARLGSSGEQDFSAFGVHPATEGFPPAAHNFAADQALLHDIEARIAANDDLLDEADNFAVNFRFARDMGISFPAAPETEQDNAEEAAPENPETAATAEAQGYVPYLERQALPGGMSEAAFELPENGDALLRFPGSGAEAECPSSEILVRSDGTGFALPLGLVAPEGVLASCIRLPRDIVCCRLAGSGAPAEPVVSITGERVSFVFAAPAPVRAKPNKSMVLMAGYVLLTLSFLWAWAIDEFKETQEPGSTVSALRSELFK